MGRYYSGDIEGKFWFTLQNSDCADRFGVEGTQPELLEYFFDEDNLEDVEKEIEAIKEKLGEKLKVIEKFFEENQGWNDRSLEEADLSRLDLKEYADLELGLRIRDCIKENGQCSFTAEC